MSQQRRDRVYKALSLIVVQVSGEMKDGKQISWNLITNIPVHDFATAQYIVRTYAKRWHVENFHKALKTGFGLEEARLEDGVKLKNLIALISIEAACVYGMLYGARQEDPPPSTDFLSQEDVSIIEKLMQTKHPSTLKEIVEFIGVLGGFSKTKKYPHPGILTFFRGWHIIRQQIIAIKLVCNR